MDHLSPKRRSKNMAAIKGRDTAPELVVRRILHGLGYRYRLHDEGLPGRPDLAFRQRGAVIFVHGCFWHQHKARNCKARLPKSNLVYWLPKLKKNVVRDRQNLRQLSRMGWRTLVVWECEINSPDLRKRLVAFLDEKRRTIE
jgi:DNA mismatch endonuclease, patch repair protein